MDPFTIKDMITVLKPVLKNRKKARNLLERFWSDKIAIIWDSEDIHRAANERELALTEAEARSILRELHQFHNHQTGIQWRDVVEIIKDHVVGRPLNKRELDRFVHKNIITIARPRTPKKRKR